MLWASQWSLCESCLEKYGLAPGLLVHSRLFLNYLLLASTLLNSGDKNWVKITAVLMLIKLTVWGEAANFV